MPTDPIAALLGGGGKSSRKAANPLAAITLKQARPKSDKRKKKPPTPQELEAEEGLIKEAGSHTMSALAWLGGSLDKAVGGRAIRTLLGKAASGVSGKPGKSNWRDLASVIPFSDTLGITNPYHDTGGRQILEQANMLKPNRPGLDWGDVGGFAAEVLTDPGTYLTGGTKTLAGQLMAKVGAKGAIKSTAKALKAHRIAGAFKTPKTKLGEKFNKVVDWARSKTGGNVGRREADVTTTINDILSNTSGAQKRGILRGLKTAAASKIKGFATMSKAQQRAATRSLLKQVGGDTLGKSFGLGLPFMEPFVKFGGGENARRFAEVLDWPAVAAFNTKKGAALRGMFVNATRAAPTPKLQARTEPLTEEIAATTAQERLKMAKGYRSYKNKLKTEMQAKGMEPRQFDDAWRMTMETTAPGLSEIPTAWRENKIHKVIKINFPSASKSARKWIEKQYRAHRRRVLEDRGGIISRGGVMPNNEAAYQADRMIDREIKTLARKLKDPSAYKPGSVSNKDIGGLISKANKLGIDTTGWAPSKKNKGLPPHEQMRAIDNARLAELKDMPRYTAETYGHRQASGFETLTDEIGDSITPVAPASSPHLEMELKKHIKDRKAAASEPRPTDRQVRVYQSELMLIHGYNSSQLGGITREKLRDMVFEARIKETEDAIKAMKRRGKFDTSPRVKEMNIEAGFTDQELKDAGATPHTDYLRTGADADSIKPVKFGQEFGGARPLQTRGISGRKREPMLSQISPTAKHGGGTTTLNRMSIDPKISGPNATLDRHDATQYIKEEYLGYTPKDEARYNRILSKIEAGADLTRGEAAWLERYQTIEKQPDWLADNMRRRAPQRAETKTPLFGNDPYSELRGTTPEAKAIALSLDTVHDAVLDSVTINPQRTGMPTLEEFYSGHGGMGMDIKRSIIRLAQKLVDAPLEHLSQVPKGLDPKSAAEAIERGVKEGEFLRAQAARILDGINPGASKEARNDAVRLIEQFKKLQIDPDEAAGMAKVMDFMHTPEILKPWTQFFDKMLQMFKGRVTSGWPAFLARNVQGLLIQELMEGGSPIKLLKYFNHAADMLAGKEIKGASKWARFAGRSITDRQATDELADMLFSVKVGRPSATETMADVVGGSPQATYKSISNELVGEEPIAFSAKGIAKHVGSDIKKAVTKKSRFKRFVKSLLGGRGSFFQDTPDPSRLLNEKWGEEANEFAERIGRIGTALREMAEGATQQVAGEASGRAHVVYDQLTPFERQWMRRLLPFYCVPDTAEILTQDGWKLVDDLSIGEMVLALNHSTGESEWVPCEAKHVYDYSGHLMSIKDRMGGFACTFDHSWPVVRDTGWNRNTQRCESTESVMEPAWTLKYGDRIPRTSNFIGSDQTGVALTEREAAIIGWVVTDGHMRTRPHSPGHTEYVVYQSRGKHLAEITELLGDDGKPSKPHPQTGVVCVRITGKLRRRIQEIMRSKADFLRVACRMSRGCAEACYDAMMKAEGCVSGSKYPDGELNSFAQNKGPVLDAFQILAQLTGRTATIRDHSGNCKQAFVLSSVHSHKKVSRDKMSVVWHSGRVWCPQTKHGTWYMRQGGNVIWTGNSYMRGTVPKVLRSMATNPKGFPAQAAKTEYRTTRGDVVPRQIVGAIPIGGEDETGNRRYLKVDLPFSQINDLFAVRPTALGTVKASGQGLLSMLRPGMKGVLEAATGQSFFQRGRPLTDLFSTTGTGLPLIDTIAMNTPASRVISTASMLRDPRKGAGTKLFNLLSGTRLSDVNLARERDTAIRDLTNEMLRGQPGVRFMEDVYIPKGQENLLSPRNRAIFDLVKNRQYRKAAEKRAEAKKSAPPKKKKTAKSKDPLAALLKSGR